MPPYKSKYNTFAFNGLDVRGEISPFVFIFKCMYINKELTLYLKANITNPNVIKTATILIITFPPTCTQACFSARQSQQGGGMLWIRIFAKNGYSTLTFGRFIF